MEAEKINAGHLTRIKAKVVGIFQLVHLPLLTPLPSFHQANKNRTEPIKSKEECKDCKIPTSPQSIDDRLEYDH